MSDIVDRLRKGTTDGSHLRWTVTDIHIEAADTIETLRAQLAQARNAALGPFKKGELVFYKSEFGDLKAQVNGYVEGWPELVFSDGSICICRPSRVSIRALREEGQ
jgi:hypothetical protein